MAKFLLLIALVIVVYLMFRGFRRDASQQHQPAQSPLKRSPAAAEDMVRCTVCGVHLPRSESFTSRGKYFCSDEHRRVGVERSSNS